MENTNNQSALSLYRNIAETIIRSGIVGKTNPEAIVTKILIGETLGLKPMQAVLGIDLINTFNESSNSVETNVFIKPKLLLALLQKSGKYTYRLLKSTDEICEIEFFELSNPPISLGTVSYTIEEAKRSGIALNKRGELKTNYKRNPREMLFYRCVQRGITFFAPEVIFGLPIYLQGVEEWSEPLPKSPTDTEDLTPSIASQNADFEIVDENLDDIISDAEPNNNLDDIQKKKEIIQKNFLDFLSSFDLDEKDNLKAPPKVFSAYQEKLTAYNLDPYKTFSLFFFEIPIFEATIGQLKSIVSFLGLNKNSKPDLELINNIKEVLYGTKF